MRFHVAPLLLLLQCAMIKFCDSSKLREKLSVNFITDYIINGHDAYPGEAPYIISLSLSNKLYSHFCGGTLISEDWILTAAHCIVIDPIGMGAIAGLYDRIELGNVTQLRTVDFGKVHSLYPGSAGPYDIALLHVSKSFHFNKFIQSAKLPNPGEIHSDTVHFYGWGTIKPKSTSLSRILQTVQMEILDWQICKKKLPKTSPLHVNNLCSDSMNKKISICSGDSGGPLVREFSETMTVELVGIASWVYTPCGKRNFPSVYTRVSAYIDWIQNVQKIFYESRL